MQSILRRRQCLHVEGSRLVLCREIISVDFENHTKYICSGVLRNFVRRGGGSTNSVEDRESGDLGR